MNSPLDIVIFGLSVTSSWGNGHATTYRALMRGLHERGHRVLFLERDLPWYAENRDMAQVPHGRVETYASIRAMQRKFERAVATADLVIVGSYVPDGVSVGEWVTQTAKGITAFYDIDTPVTLAALERGSCDYVSTRLVPHYDLYLSFTGGATLRRIERRFGARNARPLYCSVDPTVHSPEPSSDRWDLGYIGTYSQDRQVWMERLMLAAAREWKSARIVVAGAQYPTEIVWPSNVKRIEHLPPKEHRKFYNSQRFTLNLTRDEMKRAGYSPSVRLFEAAACATPIISDWWRGIETFLEPGKEILITRSAHETLECLRDLPDAERLKIGQNARERILREHTASHRAFELESYVSALRGAGWIAANAQLARAAGRGVTVGVVQSAD